MGRSIHLTGFVPPFRLHEPEKSSEATTQVGHPRTGEGEWPGATGDGSVRVVVLQ